MREIKTVTHLNLGDNIFYMHFFRKIIDTDRNIRITHHIKPNYIKELSNFIKGYEENIILKDIYLLISSITPLENQFPGWIFSWNTLVEKRKELPAILLYGDADHWNKKYPNEPHVSDTYYYDVVLLRQYKQYCDFLEVDCPFTCVEDTLLDMKELLDDNKLSDKYDFIIGNIKGMSGQWVDDKSFFDYIISNIDTSKYKVISLEPTGNKNIPSTIENGLNLMQVGNIAINAKRIISVHSSPYCVLINKYNYKKVEEFVVLHEWGKYKYSHSKSVNYCSREDFINNYKFKYLEENLVDLNSPW